MHESNTKLSKSNTKLIHFPYEIIPFFYSVFRTYCSRDAILGKIYISATRVIKFSLEPL